MFVLEPPSCFACSFSCPRNYMIRQSYSYQPGNSAYAYFKKKKKSQCVYNILLQNKKRGRRQGSNKQVSPEIRKRLSEALFLHADNKDSEVIHMKCLFFCDIVPFSSATHFIISWISKLIFIYHYISFWLLYLLLLFPK